MQTVRLIAGLGFIAVLAACQPKPEPIKPQPIYNKYGDVVGCEGGTYVPGAVDLPCMPPEDECEPQSTVGAVPCPPSGGGGREPTDPGRPSSTPPGTAAP